MKIKGAIFDMDGTIVDSLMFWDHLWQRIGQTYRNDPSFRPCDEVEGRVRTMIYEDAMRYVYGYYGFSGTEEEFVRFTSDGILDFYRSIARPKEGAVALLEALRSAGIPLCLASATSMPRIRFALECHGMLGYFDHVLSCEELGVGKDRPDIYLQAAAQMGAEPRELCVFEDSYVALETAAAAGFRTVGLYDPHNPEQERVKGASELYMSQGQTLEELIGLIGRAD